MIERALEVAIAAAQQAGQVVLSYYSAPANALVRVPQQRMRINIPVIGRLLGVDYCYLCEPRPQA